MVKKRIETETPEICEHLEYDDRNEGYCHASDKGPVVLCSYADYAAKSYYPPCTKCFIRGMTELENMENYDKVFRNR